MQFLRLMTVALVVALIGFTGAAVAGDKNTAKANLNVPVSALLERMGAKDVGFVFQTTRTDQGTDSRWLGTGPRKVLLLAGDSESAMAKGLRMRVWLSDRYDGTDSALILDMGAALATVFPNWSGRSAWLMNGLTSLRKQQKVSTVQDGVQIMLNYDRKDKAITLTLLPKKKK